MRARRKSDTSWSGPTRAFIQSDQGLLGYVRAREDERTAKQPRRPQGSGRRIDDIVEGIVDDEARSALRCEVEAGRRARAELDLLRKGLREIAPIPMEQLLTQSESAGSAPQGEPDLAALLDRLTDEEEMSRMGFVVEDGRVLLRATRQVLVRGPELKALRRIAG